MKKNKKIGFALLLIFLAVIISFLGFNYLIAKDFGKHPAVSTYKYADNLDKKLHILLAGQSLTIPLAYVQQPIPKNGENVDGIILAAVLPNFEPIAYSEVDMKLKGLDKNVVRIFPRDEARVNNLLGLFEKRQEFNKATNLVKKVYGLSFYSREAGVTTDRDEMYLEGSKKDIKSFIVCPADGATENPHCEQFLNHLGFLVEIRFAKEHLADWKLIQEKTEILLNNFRTKH